MTISAEHGITVHDWENDVTDAMRAAACDVADLHINAALAQGMTESKAFAYGTDQAMAWMRAGVLAARFAAARG
jgi:hypothetical protein